MNAGSARGRVAEGVAVGGTVVGVGEDHLAQDCLLIFNQVAIPFRVARIRSVQAQLGAR
jgi:hypothetical protein